MGGLSSKNQDNAASTRQAHHAANAPRNRRMLVHGLAVAILTSLTLSGCGGGDGADGASAAAHSAAPVKKATTGVSAPAAALLQKMGKTARLQIGLGSGQSIQDMQNQGIHPDIVDNYLVGVGPGSWPDWNTDGAYVTYTAQKDLANGATPMFTLYQMASRGDGNLSGINDPSFMNSYWSQVRTMYDRINALNTPVLVNLEPDFWGYVYSQAPNHDATQMAAVVNNQPECSWMPNTAAGIGMCLVSMARWHAPKALIGFPAAFWNAGTDVIAKEMQAVGADRADFIVAQTSDRDAGCLEAAAVDECKGRTGPFYLDENNVNTPATRWAMGCRSCGGKRRWGYRPTPRVARRRTTAITTSITCCATHGNTVACTRSPSSSVEAAPIRRRSTPTAVNSHASSVNTFRPVALECSSSDRGWTTRQATLALVVQPRAISEIQGEFLRLQALALLRMNR